MNAVAVFLALFAVALSAPVEEAFVDVTQDTHGNYKFYYKTSESERLEEGHADGSVTGTIKYIDDLGVEHALSYTSGAAGYSAVGAEVPQPVKELPEVSIAHGEHARVYHAIESLLPPLKPDGTVDEVPEVPLTKAEFLAALASVLNGNTPLKFVEDTPEINEAKAELYKAHVDAFAV